MQSTPLSRLHLLALLLSSATQATEVDIWAFDPWYEPAPPPLDGPPLSINATRNLSLLKWQILGIVGGYVLFVALLFTALLTVGKQWRRAASMSRSSLAMEMVKPSRWLAENNNDARSQKRGILSRSKSNASSLQKSPVVNQAAAFDQTVIDADKAKNEQEMARLYQAVMTGDTMAPKTLPNMKSQDFGPGGETVSLHSRSLSNATSTRSFSQRVPPQLRTGDHSAPMSPSSPPSYRSPVFSTPPQQWATSPASSRFPSQSYGWPAAGPSTVYEQNRSPAPSHNRQMSASSSRSKRQRSVRNLTISSPVATPVYAQDDETRPLSPRQYNPGPPPPPPGRHQEPRQSPATPILDDADTDDSDIIDAYGMEALDRPRPMPMTAPQRPTITVPPRVVPAAAEHSSTPLSAATSTRTLPLRTFTSQTSMGASRVDLSNPLASPPPTKVTLLSPRRERFGGQGSATLHPLTAGLPTPYSAYMPRTPITPITPRLATRAERRQRAREEGRRLATAEEAVQDEDEMWGTGL